MYWHRKPRIATLDMERPRHAEVLLEPTSIGHATLTGEEAMDRSRVVPLRLLYMHSRECQSLGSRATDAASESTERVRVTGPTTGDPYANRDRLGFQDPRT